MRDKCIMESHSTPPSFRLHTPTVDFIENRLPQYHPAFDTRYVEFDASKARFVPSSTITLAPRGSPGTLITPGVHSSPQESPRQVPGMLYDMTFWQELFPKAMDMLKADPKPKSAEDKSWGIRHLSTWADVQAKLDIALEKYDFHHGSQHVSKFRRWTRSGLDKYAVTLQQGAKLVPELDIAKPIIGAIRVVLDVS